MAERSDPQTWRRTVRPRLAVATVAFGLWSVVVLGRLVELQLFRQAEFEERAESQHSNVLDVPAQRGSFVDRHGKLLAYSVDVDTVCAVPSRIAHPADLAERLCAALGDCDAAERAAFAARMVRKKNRSLVYLRRRINVEQSRRVAALAAEVQGELKTEPFHFVKEPRRYYPNRELAAHVLGFVGDENKGLAGLEETYDSMLSGTPGQMLVEIDGQKHPQAFNQVGFPPVPGLTLELTIDAYLQHLAERELELGVAENRALAGSVVVMDPYTGEILALASWPRFNPNQFGLASTESRRNRAVQDIYEPGSTFKIVTASAALEEKAFKPGDPIDTGSGRIAVGPTRVVTEAQGHAYGTISFTDVIVKSSNVGAIKIGFRLGAALLGRYVERFGFGTRLSPDFPAENAGIVWRPSQWTDGALASVSMGYQIGVTPLQMATAASVVANGGELVQPRVVRAVIDGNHRTVVPRRVLRRVTSRGTAAELTGIMEGVVERGTGKLARLEDFEVAGKTGTANKNENGSYIKTDYNVSFVGFVPASKPALTILVVIDTPRGPNRPFGGTVSAPIFHRIADAALRYLGVPPTVDPAPPLLVARSEEQREVAVSGPAVPLTIVPAAGPSTSERIVLPELRGMSGREALRVLARLGVIPRVAGEGTVIDQDPPAGTPVEPGGGCRLALGRSNPGLLP